MSNAFVFKYAEELAKKNYLALTARVALESSIRVLVENGVGEEIIKRFFDSFMEDVLPSSLKETHEDVNDCLTWHDGCHCNTQTLGHNIERAEFAEDVAEAVVEELEFTYSHPMAAEDGDVWVERTKVPHLYQAYKAYMERKKKREAGL